MCWKRSASRPIGQAIGGTVPPCHLLIRLSETRDPTSPATRLKQAARTFINKMSLVPLWRCRGNKYHTHCLVYCLSSCLECEFPLDF